MEIFHYHPDTGAFLSVGVADGSPLEPGVFLIPAHATTTAPPADVPQGSHAVFANGAWSVELIPAVETVDDILQSDAMATISDPVEKLRIFLGANPDVAALLH